jgi:hypothetical protein
MKRSLDCMSGMFWSGCLSSLPFITAAVMPLYWAQLFRLHVLTRRYAEWLLVTSPSERQRLMIRDFILCITWT